jgi:hypothetical protein
VATLKPCRQEHDTHGEHSGDGWVETGLAFTTRYGTPNELPTFTEFDRRIKSYTEVVSSAAHEAFRKLADQLGA